MKAGLNMPVPPGKNLAQSGVRWGPDPQLM